MTKLQKHSGFLNRKTVITPGFGHSLHGDTMLTIREFCAFARISLTHFYNLKARGLGPNLTHLGASVRISKKSAEEWVEKHTKEVA